MCGDRCKPSLSHSLSSTPGQLMRLRWISRHIDTGGRSDPSSGMKKLTAHSTLKSNKSRFKSWLSHLFGICPQEEYLVLSLYFLVVVLPISRALWAVQSLCTRQSYELTQKSSLPLSHVPYDIIFPDFQESFPNCTEAFYRLVATSSATLYSS